MLLLFALSACCVTGTQRSVEYGMASYYGEDFHGRKTASGEVFNRWDYTCAHRYLPFGTRIKVTNLDNRQSVIVRVNDRGPFVRGRVIDLSYAAARQIGMITEGLVRVMLEVIR